MTSKIYQNKDPLKHDTCDTYNKNVIWVPQNQITNSLPKTFVKDGVEIDYHTGDAKLKRDNFTLYINQYSSLTVKELRASFHRMIDIILIKLSEGFNHEKTIKVALRDYIKICGLDSIKEARKQLNTDLEIFFRCSVSYQSPKGIKSCNYSEMRLCQDYDIENSIIYVTLGDKFYNMLISKSMSRMLIPIVILQCNFRKNPNSFFLGRKLSEYYRANFNKNHNNVIAVKSLLKCCPQLKNWEKSTQKKRDILQAFERDLAFLEEQIGWHYCRAKGEELNEEENENIANDDFPTFINLYIKYNFTEEYKDLMKANIKPINQKALRNNARKKFKRKKK
jgi:hypothetical protein